MFVISFRVGYKSFWYGSVRVMIITIERTDAKMFKDPKLCLGMTRLFLALGVITALWLFGLLSGLLSLGSGNEYWVADTSMACAALSLGFDRRAQKLAKAGAR